MLHLLLLHSIQQGIPVAMVRHLQVVHQNRNSCLDSRYFLQQKAAPTNTNWSKTKSIQKHSMINQILITIKPNYNLLNTVIQIY